MNSTNSPVAIRHQYLILSWTNFYFNLYFFSCRHFPGIITSHQLARSLDVILSKQGFEKEKTLLGTSLCCDEVCRDMEDELKEVYGQNFSFGGIAGFPFGGCTAFGAMCHHIPLDGSCVIVYGSHVGIDFDGVIGKVNRKGHHGSGACCNTAVASLAYIKAVKEGITIHSPDPSDPIDAQQVFVDSAMLKHSDRLFNAENENIELPHAINDCQTDLLKRIMDKCIKDIPDGTKVAIIGGVQVNTPEGTPDYFLPKRFDLCNSNGELVEDLLQSLIDEGHKDPKEIIRQKKLDRLMAKAKEGTIDVPMNP
jgi:hypothetical protein